MITLRVKPTTVTPGGSADVVRLDIVLDFEDFVGLFDQLEVWRCPTGEAGPYEEVTAAAWRGARQPADGGDPPSPSITGPSAALSGKVLAFLINDTVPVSVEITGTDPLTTSAVATQVRAAGLSSWVDSTGQLVVETMQPGSAAQLEVTGDDAAGALGLSIGAPTNGKEPRITLQSTQDRYEFLDQRSSSRAFYKTRFRNRLTAVVSDFSQAFGSTLTLAIDNDAVATGSLDLVDVQGRPVANREVKIHTNFNGILVNGKLMAGTSITLTTDLNGHLDVVLVRGQQVSVAVTGTDLVRDITVPTDPAITKFNLFDPTLAGPDIFQVQVPDLVYAERRSL
jgi:hypothetical protein